MCLLEGVWRTSSHTRSILAPVLAPYWTNVFGFINKKILVNFPSVDPLIATLGVKTYLIKSGEKVKKRRYLLGILLVAAKKNITINWLQRRLQTLENVYGQ